MDPQFEPFLNIKSNRLPLPSEIITLRSLVNAECEVLSSIDKSIEHAQVTTLAAERRLEDAKLELEAAVSSLQAARASVVSLQTAREPIVAYGA